MLLRAAVEVTGLESSSKAAALRLWVALAVVVAAAATVAARQIGRR